MVRVGLFVCAALSFILLPSAASAQTEPGPIPVFAADVRLALPRFKADPAVASVLAVAPTDLPTLGLGFVAGAHIYPLRTKAITFGLGAEFLRSRARRTKPPATEGGVEGPAVRTRLSGVSPQVSFNFGHRDGWSYISGGMGWMSLTSVIETTGPAGADDDAARSKTINYGGGARWFATKHVAVSLDLRFYAVSPRTATATDRGYPRMTVMVFTGGLAFR
ncbi:MAG TPA: hypothetical protein VG106_04965 [Vicinamibacterales bacterium]|nr:hypothetical protein [Vicinamibacterales bacterium]